VTSLLAVALTLMNLTWPDQLRAEALDIAGAMLAVLPVPDGLLFEARVAEAATRLRCVVAVADVELVCDALREASDRLGNQLAALEEVYRRYVSGDDRLHR
jgi:hypothetical protein